MELSKRLQAVAFYVTAGYRLADIGTDHAYIPIELVRTGHIPQAIAMDVNRGPLERAEENIREHGLSAQIRTRLSDGFAALGEGEAQSVVIAGMGGGLTIRILKEGERVVEDGKYYPMMKVAPPQRKADRTGVGPDSRDIVCGEAVWDEMELRYGKYLLQNRHPVLRRYLEREQRIKKDILKSLEGQDSRRILMRRRELEKELEYIEKGLMSYAV